MGILTNKCKDCNKKIGLLAKRCKSCNAIWLHKIGKIDTKGKKNGHYKDGRNLIRRHCIDCGKEVKSHNPKTKRCQKCFGKTERGINNPNFGATKNQLQEHHIDLNTKNNKKNNKLILTSSKHKKIHSYAYNYLVEMDLIRKYIKWFNNKYGLE